MPLLGLVIINVPVKVPEACLQDVSGIEQLANLKGPRHLFSSTKYRPSGQGYELTMLARDTGLDYPNCRPQPPPTPPVRRPPSYLLWLRLQ